MKVVVLAVVVSLGCGDNNPAPGPAFVTTVELQRIAQIPDVPVLVASPPGDSRLFVVEREGRIRLIENDRVLYDPFLDLSEQANGPVLTDYGELGLLGLAFHPQYDINGVFYVAYTARNPGDSSNVQRDVLARCTVSADPDFASRQSCVEVLSIPDLQTNHNGGMIEFGLDGYLYWGTGDGGSGNPGNSQALVDDAPANTHALLGKILRLDVDHPSSGFEYGIPADNPYAAGGGRPEIWIRGLRNPWRWSFDRLTGDLWIGDVGQKQIEELDVLRPSQQAGANLGWRVWEGSLCYDGDCPNTPQVVPKDERVAADNWHSIIAGQVYRGSRFPELAGWHFYTDHFAGGLAAARLEADDTLTVVDLPGTYPKYMSSIHAAGDGEIYATDIAGNVYHLVATAP